MVLVPTVAVAVMEPQHHQLARAAADTQAAEMDQTTVVGTEVPEEVEVLITLEQIKLVLQTQTRVMVM